LKEAERRAKAEKEALKKGGKPMPSPVAPALERKLANAIESGTYKRESFVEEIRIDVSYSVVLLML
jgi:hypothetical protein